MPSLIPSLGSLPSAVADSYLIGSLLADESLHAISPSGDDWLLSKFALGDLDELIVDGIGALPGHYATLTAAVAACTGDEVIRIVADTTEPAGLLSIDVDVTIIWDALVVFSGKADELLIGGIASNVNVVIIFGERGELEVVSPGTLSFEAQNSATLHLINPRFAIGDDFNLTSTGGSVIFAKNVHFLPDFLGSHNCTCASSSAMFIDGILANGSGALSISSYGLMEISNLAGDSSAAIAINSGSEMYLCDTQLGGTHNVTFAVGSGFLKARNCRFWASGNHTIINADYAGAGTLFESCEILHTTPSAYKAIYATTGTTLEMHHCTIVGDITEGVVPDAGDFSNVWNGVTWGIAATNEQSGTTYTFAIDDQGKIVYSTNGSATTFTVPPNSSVAFPVGAMINVQQGGAGALTIAQGSGVTINSLNGNLQLAGQYAEATLRKTATDTWTLVGALI